MDHAIARVVHEAIHSYGEDAALITCEMEYHDAAGMYFTEIKPVRDTAASVSLAYNGCHGGDSLHCTVGNTSFEVVPFRTDADLSYLRQLLDAVLAGDFEESGSRARLHTVNGTVRVGAVSPPLPWRMKRVRRYGGLRSV